MKFNFSKMLDYDDAKKIYTKYLKNEQSVLSIAKDLDIKIEDVYGLVELLNHFDLYLEIINVNGEEIVKKHRKKMATRHKNVKIPMKECTKTTLGLVSDTHLCCSFVLQS